MAARDLFEELIVPGALDRWIAEQREEGLHLEFKGRERAPNGPPAKPDVLDNEDKSVIAKAMSGFANVDGGVLVLGLNTSKLRTGDPSRLAEDQTLLERPQVLTERVRAAIKDATSPMIAGVDVRAVERADGRGVVAVFVPPSDGGPHRVTIGSEKVRDRYFIRSGDSTNVAEHPILSALFGRTPPPRLRLFATWNREESTISRVRGWTARVSLFLRNDGRGTAINPVVSVMQSSQSRIVDSHGIVAGHRTTAERRLMFKPEAVRDRLYSGMEDSLGSLSLNLQPEEAFDLAATIYADGCAPTHVAASLQLTGAGTVEIPPSSNYTSVVECASSIG